MCRFLSTNYLKLHAKRAENNNTTGLIMYQHLTGHQLILSASQPQTGPKKKTKEVNKGMFSKYLLELFLLNWRFVSKA
jgi:hypothetical protein